MTARRIPILPTLIVLAAVALMVRLGLWQLDRKAEKEALIARYAAAATMSSEIAWPGAAAAKMQLYRRARLTCAGVTSSIAKSGLNAAGEAGLGHTATCRLPDGSSAAVVIGWSNDPAPRDWRGGEVTGVIAPGPRLVADPPLAGLAANKVPDPAGLPNNHLSYAVQWFLFAGVALVIYALALRKRLADSGAPR